MKKFKVFNDVNKKFIIPSAIIFAYVMLIFGFTFLILGSLKEKYTMIYFAIGFIIFSTVIYSILIIYGVWYYLKKRR